MNPRFHLCPTGALAAATAALLLAASPVGAPVDGEWKLIVSHVTRIPGPPRGP